MFSGLIKSASLCIGGESMTEWKCSHGHRTDKQRSQVETVCGYIERRKVQTKTNVEVFNILKDYYKSQDLNSWKYVDNRKVPHRLSKKQRKMKKFLEILEQISSFPDFERDLDMWLLQWSKNATDQDISKIHEKVFSVRLCKPEAKHSYHEMFCWFRTIDSLLKREMDRNYTKNVSLPPCQASVRKVKDYHSGEVDRYESEYLNMWKLFTMK